MNKKLLFSVGAVAVLLIYIFFANRQGSNDFPEMDWDGKAQEIVLTSPDNTVKIINKEDKWVLNDEAYPADEKAVDDIEKKIKELEIVDLISSKGYFSKYELTAEKGIEVKVKKDNKIVKKILFGKKGSTNRHTYIKVDDKPEVYMAAGTFDGIFKKTVDELRNKDIMKIDKEGVSSFDVTYKGRKFSFHKKLEEVKLEAKVKEQDKDKKSENKQVWICKGYEKINLETSKVEQLIASFNPLKADSYPDIKKETLKNPICIVKMKAYEKDIELKIYNKNKDKKYICSSNESPYVFLMNEWKAKKFFVEKLDDLKKR